MNRIALHAGWLAAVLFLAALGGLGATLPGFSQ